MSANCIVENSNLTGNTEAGINIDYCSGIEVRNSNISENGLYGIQIYQSQSNVLSGNLVMGHETGMMLNMSGHNTLRNNAIKSNRYDFGVDGTGLSDFLQDIDVSNTVDYKPMYYLANKKDVEINSSSNAGYVALVNSSNIHVRSLDLEGNIEGILLAYSHSCIIQKNNITRNLHGAFLYYSQNNKLDGGVVVGNHDGVSLFYSQGNLVNSNLVASNEEYGISVEFSQDNVISDNNVTANGGDGFYVYRSLNCSIRSNMVFANGAGVRLQFSDGSTVEDNFIANNTWDGIYMVGSSDCTTHGNDVTGNIGFGVRFLYTAFNVVNENTIANNKEDGLNFYKCDNVSVSVNVLLRNVVGVYFYKCFDCTMVFNRISNHSREGVKVADCQNIVVSQNTMLGNGRAGLGLFYSSNITVESNVLDRNMNHGIWLDNSSNVVLAGNDVTSNEWDGIYLHVSSSCAVTNNLVARNMNGLHFWVADNNTITYNVVKENSNYGMYLEDCLYNTIFHNSFSNNTRQVRTLGKGKNSWDEGYPSGGNFWSDYAGGDFYWGLYQNLSGSDGLGDTPYIIDDENKDRYPLMTPVRTHDISIIDVDVYSYVVYVGWMVEVNVSVRNVGNFLESFNVTAFCNNTVMGTCAVSNLSVGGVVTIPFLSNTTGHAYGNYTISAVADYVLGETKTDDNILVDGIIFVTIPGDVDADGDVDLYDVVKMAVVYGSRIGDAKFGANLDINANRKIDIYDMVIACTHYGQKQP